MKGYLLLSAPVEPVEEKTEDYDAHGHNDFELMRIYAGTLGAIGDCLVKPPKTWAAYGKTEGDLLRIVAMEFHELQVGKNENNSEVIKKELIDLATACIHAHHYL